MNYEALEDALVLQLAGQFFEVAPLPDNESQKVQNQKPRVYVMYNSSDYSDTENMNGVVQEDKIKVGFEIRSMARRGANGIFAIGSKVQEKILGYKLPGLDKFQLVVFSPLEGCGPNNWVYYMQFSTVGHIIENQPDPIYPILKNPEFVKP